VGVAHHQDRALVVVQLVRQVANGVDLHLVEHALGSPLEGSGTRKTGLEAAGLSGCGE
jgi:hypothetical protein